MSFRDNFTLVRSYFQQSDLGRKFFRKNRKFWDNWRRGLPEPDPRSVIVSELETNCFMALNNAVVASALAAAKGCRVVYVAKKREGTMSLRHVRTSFGPCYFESIEDLASPDEKTIEHEARELFATLRTPAEILDLK